MEVLPQPAYSVATIEGSGKQKRDYMLRVRLSPTEVYELKAVVNSLHVSESATIRWLISNYPEIGRAKAITLAYANLQDAESALRGLVAAKKD